MSWIVAGISAGASLLSSASANKAEKEANEIAKRQDLIDVEQLKGDVAIQEYNSRLNLSQLESKQVVMSSAMGKQVGEGSMQNIQNVGRMDLETNIARGNEEVTRAEKYGKISASARDKASKAKATQRTIGTVSSGLMSFAKAFD